MRDQIVVDFHLRGISTKLIELSSSGDPAPRQTPKIGQIWEIWKSKAVNHMVVISGKVSRPCALGGPTLSC